MKLYVVGSNSPNPDDWSMWDQVKLVIAENKQRAIEVAYEFKVGALTEDNYDIFNNMPVAEIDLNKEQLLMSEPEPRWGSDI